MSGKPLPPKPLAPYRRDPRGKKPAVDWAALDWSLNNVEVARRHGVSPQAVWAARSRYSAPAKAPSPSARLLDYARRNRERLHGLPAAEVLAAAGVSLAPATAREILTRAGVRPAPRPPPASKLDRADWRLPTADLARVWGAYPPRVCVCRRRAGAPPALWDLRRPETKADPKYRRLLAAERRKAEAAAARYPPRP